MLRLALAALHLLALGIGLGAVWGRARALGGPRDSRALRRALAADGWWGFAALLWIGTGLWRLLAGTEKATGYYLQNHLFMAKMGLLALILLLEAWPMLTLIRWRVDPSRSETGAGAAAARRISAISYVETVLVLGMIVAAVAMARGYGAVARP
jgi:putative membrane protein